MIGIIRKVIITDGGDFINFQWEFGKGITYPPINPATGKRDGGESISGNVPATGPKEGQAHEDW